MIDPASGPLLFDTSAESWLARSQRPEVIAWVRDYLARYQVHISAVTVLERVRGYALLWRRVKAGRRAHVESLRIAYLDRLGIVWPVDAALAALAGEIMALIPDPPTPPKRSHQRAESRGERLARWRFDTIIAATSLVVNMPLVHNNAADFEAIRSAIERSPGRFPGLGPLELIRCTLLA